MVKHTQTIRRQIVCVYFVGLALKGLAYTSLDLFQSPHLPLGDLLVVLSYL